MPSWALTDYSHKVRTRKSLLRRLRAAARRPQRFGVRDSDWLIFPPCRDQRICWDVGQMWNATLKVYGLVPPILGEYRGDSNWTKVQLNINSKALVAHIDRVVWRQPSDDLSYLATVNMVCRSQKYFWSPSSTSTWRLKKWRHHDVIGVEVHSWSWRWTPKNNLRPENE